MQNHIKHITPKKILLITIHIIMALLLMPPLPISAFVPKPIKPPSNTIPPPKPADIIDGTQRLVDTTIIGELAPEVTNPINNAIRWFYEQIGIIDPEDDMRNRVLVLTDMERQLTAEFAHMGQQIHSQVTENPPVIRVIEVDSQGQRIEVPGVPITMSRNDLKDIIMGTADLFSLTEDVFRIIDILRENQPQEPHHLLLGFCPQGIPILDINNGIASGNSIIIGVNNDSRIPILQHAVRQYTAIDGTIVEYKDVVINDSGRTAIYRYIHGHGLGARKRSQNNDQAYFIGIFRVLGRNDRIFNVSRIAPGSGLIASATLLNNYPYVMRLDVNSIKPPVVSPMLPTAPALPTLAPVNAVHNLDAIMAQIDALSHDVNRIGENIGMFVPLITPDMFPELSPAQFEQLRRDINEQIGLNELIIPWEQLQELMSLNAVVNINLTGLLRPQQPFELDPEFEQIPSLLSRIGNAILALPQQIARAIEDVLRRIRNEPIPELPYTPPEMEFDFGINLMDYFPFSIPRDIYDLVMVMAGQTPTGLIGASTHERALFAHYQEVGYMTAETYNIIGSMVNMSRTPPRLEVPIYLPDLTGGRIDNANAQVAHTFVIDFGEFETLILIVNWSVLLGFVLGLIYITPKVIIW